MSEYLRERAAELALTEAKFPSLEKLSLFIEAIKKVNQLAYQTEKFHQILSIVVNSNLKPAD